MPLNAIPVRWARAPSPEQASPRATSSAHLHALRGRPWTVGSRAATDGSTQRSARARVALAARDPWRAFRRGRRTSPCGRRRKGSGSRRASGGSDPAPRAGSRRPRRPRWSASSRAHRCSPRQRARPLEVRETGTRIAVEAARPVLSNARGVMVCVPLCTKVVNRVDVRDPAVAGARLESTQNSTRLIGLPDVAVAASGPSCPRWPPRSERQGHGRPHRRRRAAAGVAGRRRSTWRWRPGTGHCRRHPTSGRRPDAGPRRARRTCGWGSSTRSRRRCRGGTEKAVALSSEREADRAAARQRERARSDARDRRVRRRRVDRERPRRGRRVDVARGVGRADENVCDAVGERGRRPAARCSATPSAPGVELHSNVAPASVDVNVNDGGSVVRRARRAAGDRRVRRGRVDRERPRRGRRRRRCRPRRSRAPRTCAAVGQAACRPAARCTRVRPAPPAVELALERRARLGRR